MWRVTNVYIKDICSKEQKRLHSAEIHDTKSAAFDSTSAVMSWLISVNNSTRLCVSLNMFSSSVNLIQQSTDLCRVQEMCIFRELISVCHWIRFSNSLDLIQCATELRSILHWSCVNSSPHSISLTCVETLVYVTIIVNFDIDRIQWTTEVTSVAYCIQLREALNSTSEILNCLQWNTELNSVKY